MAEKSREREGAKSQFLQQEGVKTSGESAGEIMSAVRLFPKVLVSGVTRERKQFVSL